jgi:glycosyltransferase involved in cell wall biosynthesis
MENNKKTIYISTYDDIKNPHYGGGGAVAVHEVAKRLSTTYTVRVVSWNYSGKTREVIDGVTYERFGIPFLAPKLAMFVYQVALPFVSLHKDYAVWLESFCPPFTTSFMPVFSKKPVVGIVHMLAAEDMERKYKLPFHIIQNMGLRKYKHLLVTSDTIKNKLQSISTGCSPIVISNGISKVYTARFPKQKYVLFLGRIEVDQKGIDLLISAFSEFHKVHKAYTLIIAGNGEPGEITKMKNLIASVGLQKEILVKGRVSGKQKADLLVNASCVVIPSRFETYSLVALEALAHGAPVICFTIPGLSWIPKNAAIKVQAFNTHLLSDALARIVTEKSLAYSLVTQGQAYAKQFTWDTVAKKYSEYVKHI